MGKFEIFKFILGRFRRHGLATMSAETFKILNAADPAKIYSRPKFSSFSEKYFLTSLTISKLSKILISAQIQSLGCHFNRANQTLMARSLKTMRQSYKYDFFRKIMLWWFWFLWSVEFFKNGPEPASFCLFSFFPNKQFQQKIVDLSRIGTNHQNRTRAHWPLDHHHSPIGCKFLNSQ